jgi:hypothetical protein
MNGRTFERRIMTESNITEETLKLVQEAQKPGVFNLADVIKGRGYPQKDVSVYIDGAAAFELVELEDKMKALAEDSAEYKELEEKAEELAKVVQASKLTFTMRGVGQGVVERVSEQADEKFGKDSENTGDVNTDWFKYYITSLVASNIIRVTDPEGNVDETLLDYDSMSEIRDNIPADAWGVLVNTMQKLTLATGYFKGLTDAGFLPKS